MTTAQREPKTAALARRAATPRQKQQKAKVRLPKRVREEGDKPGTGHWRVYFLDHLIQTSNVSAAAAYAGTVPSRAYRTRRQDPEFAAQWDWALAEGYRNLELDLLAYLRSPKPEHKMDVASAIRLLTLHRQKAAQSHAEEDNRSEQEVLDSIDAMIDEMCERAAANAAQHDAADPDDEQA